MIERVLEAFFRHWVLVLLPLFAVPIDVTAWVFSTPPQYEAQAGVWVERATYLSSSTDELTRYLPPASVQRGRLMELLQTRSFANAVVSGTPLGDQAKTPEGAAEIDQIFARDFDAVQSGDHFLVIRFRSVDSATAVSVVNSVVDQFRSRLSDDRRVQAQLAISFYQSLLNDSQTALNAARTELSKYLSNNPRVAQTLTQNGIEVARLDPQFAELQGRVDTASRDADNARSSLQAAQLDVSAANKSDALGLQIVDPTSVSATPSRQLKKLLAYPIAALLAGLVLSAGLLALFTLLDHSVRSMEDLATDAPILGIIPRFETRSLRVTGAHPTRRALASVAGAPLPGKRRAS